MSEPKQLEVLGLSLQELSEVVASMGQPEYRAQQLFPAIYGQRVGLLQSISTLPQSFRQEMEDKGYRSGLPVLDKRYVSSDGTVRYLIAFPDGQSVETVWMPEGDGGEAGDGSDAGDHAGGGDRGKGDWDRATICVSSQVGCAVDCQFCMTALLGIKRNLSAGEIVGQVI